MAFIERENEILKTIKILIEKGLDFIVVGGYAVSSHAKHRFSVDCDIVISKKNLKKFVEILESRGYIKHIEKGGFDPIYAGEFVNYKKKVAGYPVTFDLLVNSLVSRSTGAAWSFEYIEDHSTEVNLPGLESSIRCKVPEKELLIAFKIHSSRKTDVRDLIMLQEYVKLEKILNHIRRGDINLLKTQIKKIISSLEDKTLEDSLKGVFSLTMDVKRQIEATKNLIDEILKEKLKEDLLLFLKDLEKIATSSEHLQDELEDKEDAIVQFRVPNVVEAFIEIKNGQLTAGEGRRDNPDGVYEMTEENVQNLLAGKNDIFYTYLVSVLRFKENNK